jgi:hypothetical protein
VFVLGKFLSV